MATLRQVSAVMIAALVIGGGGAVAFTGVISASGTTPNYPNAASVSFISFCADGAGGPTEDDVSVTPVLTDTYDETKLWTVSFTTSNSPTVDYVILKGGNVGTSPGGFLLKIDSPVSSPISVFDSNAVDISNDYTFPNDFGDGNSCLGDDTGVKFEYDEDTNTFSTEEE